MKFPEADFEIMPLPIIGPYNVQRFRQFGAEDSAQFYVVKGAEGSTKRPYSMYPVCGRSHINYLGNNVLIFGAEPRGQFKSINYVYIVVGNAVFRVDSAYNAVQVGTLKSTGGNVYFCFLVVNTIVFACFVDSQKIYIYQEDTGIFSMVTDPNAPGNISVTNSAGEAVLTKPGFIVSFGNRIAVSVADSAQFYLSVINLLTFNNTTNTSYFSAKTCFSIGSELTGTPPDDTISTAGAAVFAQEDGIIRQMGVLNNTLYIMSDYLAGVWSNLPAMFSGTGAYFPWKKSSTYDWNYGIADPLSLDIDFGRMVFLAQNADGLLQVMVNTGGYPEPISTEAIDVLFQKYSNTFGNNSPFLSGNACGFLYQYENKVFYRLSGGNYDGNQILDQEGNNNSIEYKFDTGTWHRCIEANGERCRIQRHVYFNGKHLVTVQGDNTVYEMSGKFYFNEIRNPAEPNPQAIDAYVQQPFRYERITGNISDPDSGYIEFETQYVEIDFVFGDSNIVFSEGPFQNTVFIVDEQPAPDGTPQYIIDENPSPTGEDVYLITEDSNTPSLEDTTYNYLYNPHIELFYSDDGGISYNSADVREFSQQGKYQWRMRWYQLGTSRNRTYKLVCVSGVPIVILGGVMMVRRISGGAN